MVVAGVVSWAGWEEKGDDEAVVRRGKDRREAGAVARRTGRAAPRDRRPRTWCMMVLLVVVWCCCSDEEPVFFWAMRQNNVCGWGE